MDLTYPPEAEAFRKEIRTWLEENLPQGWFEAGFELQGEARAEFNRQWPTKLYDGGWICASWPAEYGGKGLSTIENVVLSEEFAKAGAPLRADFFGDTLVGPTLLQWGSEDQKKEFLPKILSGEIRWCQGFSEPDSGSDLASLKTTAVLDGEEWVVNGQKVWTTQAQHADYVFLLARTDPTATKHHGISYLLVPMQQSGIEVRPIVQPDGTAEFNEVFFDNARCPKDNVVGGVNNGWQVANTTLGFERGSSATTSYRRFEKELEQIIEKATQTGKVADPLTRQRLARAYTTVQIMKVNGWRSLTAALTGKKDAGVAALGASNKMFWSEYHRDVMELAMDVWGLDAQVLTGLDDVDAWPGVQRIAGRPSYPVNPMQQAFFFSRSETIWGGTAEIQRNIVGERVLGLPGNRSPLPDDPGGAVATVRYGEAASQYVELWRPAGDGPFATVVLLHGGYWRDRYDLHLMDGLGAQLAEQGWLAANLEYRRVGADGGGWPSTFEDVRAGLAAIADLPDVDEDAWSASAIRREVISRYWRRYRIGSQPRLRWPP